MMINKFGEFIYSEEDVFNALMYSNTSDIGPFLIDDINNIDEINKLIKYKAFIQYIESDKSIAEFDKDNQDSWFMPQQYKDLDIAEYIISLCKTDEEIIRCGKELLIYQKYDLFNLLRYLVYLVDVMKQHNIIWGVGRGSSVSSYVLYKIGIHKINSILYDLDISEFLR